MVQINSGSDATERWLRINAAKARRALRDPAVRATVSALLLGTDPESDRKRRLKRLGELERELAEMEFRWIPMSDEDAPS